MVWRGFLIPRLPRKTVARPNRNFPFEGQENIAAPPEITRD
jgi:hypothetical protein